jgi:Xaa-Pro aminopeptidase
MKKTPVLHLLSSIRNPSSPKPPDIELYKKITSRVLGTSIESAQLLIEHMRMVKDKHEIAAMEKAVAITHKGITDLISKATPGVTEFYLESILNESFRRQGAQHVAFPAIVGAGENAAILHYESKDKNIEAGQLLLLDVGAQWNQYCADISRTIPIDGKFSERQAELYELVLKAQKAAIDKIKPGVMIRDVHEAATAVFRDAGLLKYYFHGTSHHLGIDTHDVNDSNLPLAPGMVITVEPGLYIDDEKIGIRIEDDVLVTENGYRVLSKDIPKTIKDVEEWVQQSRD